MWKKQTDNKEDLSSNVSFSIIQMKKYKAKGGIGKNYFLVDAVEFKNKNLTA